METDLAQEAVAAALAGNWPEALNLNLQILVVSPQNIDALNRLGRAYAELNKFEKAKKSAEKVLQIDKVNKIAKNNLEKWSQIKNSKYKMKSSQIKMHSFLEEPGKTRITSLQDLCDKTLLAQLSPGEEIILVPHLHRVSVTTTDNKYLGRLKDDLALRLINLIKNDYEYETRIKSVTPKEITIFIAETKEGKNSTKTLL